MASKKAKSKATTTTRNGGAAPKKKRATSPTTARTGAAAPKKKRAAVPAANKRAAPVKAAKKTVAAAVAGKPSARRVAAKPATPSADPDRSGSVVPGSKAPEFRLQDHLGQWVSSKELRGAPYVLYFYPKDDTPGCTQEACDFRDAISAFKRAGARVLGVSPDPVAAHAKFVTKHRLPFTLLSDNSRDLCNAYGTWVKKRLYGREYMGVERSTFVIGASGLVRRVWRGVKVPGHAAAVLAALRERG